MAWNYLFGEGENHFDPQLLDSIKDKRNEEVESTLQNADNLCTAVDSTGACLLHYSADCGNEVITQLLIKLGAKVDLQNEKGQTPLILATKNEHEETIRVLLENDADIYITDKNEVSALQLVVQEPLILPVIIEMFLAQIKIDCSDSNEIAKKLLQVNCPLYIVARLQNVGIVKSLLSEDTPIDAVDSNSNQTALHVAVQNQDLETVKLLVDRGANFNALDIRKQTPLALIRNFEETKILDILVKRGTDLALCSQDGVMQIYSVLMSGTSEALKIIVRSGLDIHAKDLHEQTIMHYLAKNVNDGIIEVVDEWISEADSKKNNSSADSIQSENNDRESSASKIITYEKSKIDFNARDKDGRTPLHNAMAAGNSKFAEYLIKKGADLNVKTNDGMTLFFKALESKSDSTINQRVPCVEVIMKSGVLHPVVELERYLEIYNTKSAIHRDFQFLQPILAYMIIRQGKGERIPHDIFEFINRHSKLKDFVHSYMKDIEQMKKIEFSGPEQTMFDFLIADNEKKVENFQYCYSPMKDLIKKHNFNAIYSGTLEKNYSLLTKQLAMDFECILGFVAFCIVGFAIIIIGVVVFQLIFNREEFLELLYEYIPMAFLYGILSFITYVSLKAIGFFKLFAYIWWWGNEEEITS